MTLQPTKTQLEDAACAGGVKYMTGDECAGIWALPRDKKTESGYHWQPHLPTTQGKADLLDLMIAAGIEYVVGYNCLTASSEHQSLKTVQIVDGNKHAALAQAVIEVAAQIGAKMKGGV